MTDAQFERICNLISGQTQAIAAQLFSIAYLVGMALALGMGWKVSGCIWGPILSLLSWVRVGYLMAAQ